MSLARDRARLLELLRALSFERRKVVLASGKESDFYVDCKRTTLTAEGHVLVGRLLFDRVRKVRPLVRAAGGELREMERHGLESFCCGAGGGRILAEEKLGSRINVARVQMAQATGAPLLVSNCPFCLTMFEDGIKTASTSSAPPERCWR